jgi:hypothetical protein
MFDDAGRVVFTALRDAAQDRLGPSHPCREALARAATEPRGEAVAAAEGAMRELPEVERVAILGAAHRALRSDPRAWLALWPGGPARQ